MQQNQWKMKSGCLPCHISEAGVEDLCRSIFDVKRFAGRCGGEVQRVNAVTIAKRAQE